MSAPFKNALEFVIHVENNIGYSPARNGMPLWRARAIAAGQVKKVIEENPELYTWDNLALAVAYLVTKRLTRTPVGVMRYVEVALEHAYVPPVLPVTDQINEALAWEQQHEDADSEYWDRRLFLAFSEKAQLDVLAEWRAARF